MIEFLLTAALALGQADANESHLYLYRTLLVRAAPGDLLEVIDLYKARMPVQDAAGDARPFIMRHSQGDQWDLLLLFPMGSFSEYYSAERVDRRSLAADSSQDHPSTSFVSRSQKPITITSRCSSPSPASERRYWSIGRWRTTT